MISKEDVLHLAELARLRLSDAEVENLQKDMTEILQYVGQVSAVSQSELREVPLLHNVMRADTPRGADDAVAGKEEALRKAFPTREGDYNVVRKIIDKQSE